MPVVGEPPKIVQRIESNEPDEEVDVLVNVNELPLHTVVSLTLNEAVGIGVVDAV